MKKPAYVAAIAVMAVTFLGACSSDGNTDPSTSPSASPTTSAEPTGSAAPSEDPELVNQPIAGEQLVTPADYARENATGSPSWTIVDAPEVDGIAVVVNLYGSPTCQPAPGRVQQVEGTTTEYTIELMASVGDCDTNYSGPYPWRFTGFAEAPTAISLIPADGAEPVLLPQQ